LETGLAKNKLEWAKFPGGPSPTLSKSKKEERGKCDMKIPRRKKSLTGEEKRRAEDAGLRILRGKAFRSPQGDGTKPSTEERKARLEK